RHAEADAEQRRAVELWEAKGATLLVERVRREVPPAEPIGRAPGGPTGVAVARSRRVVANAATANVARYDTAVAARDAGAWEHLYATDFEAVNHPTGGLTYGREGALATWRSVHAAGDVTLLHEPLATLGDSLALCRLSYAGSGASGRRFDFGPYESRAILLVEVDVGSRRRREERFAEQHLGDAIVRLYERYAELLPDGPERNRAATISRTV